MSTIAENAQITNQEFHWLLTIIESRINNFLNRDDPNFTEQDANLPAPDISPGWMECHC